MTLDGDRRYQSRDQLQAELDDLRRRLLPVFAGAMLLVLPAWLAYLSAADWVLGPVDIAALLSLPCVYVILRLRDAHYAWACRTLLLSLILMGSLIVAGQPAPIVMAFGAVIPIIGNGLGGAIESFMFTALAWTSTTFAWHLATGASPDSAVLAVLALYLLVWAVTLLVGQPLRTSMSSALEAWDRARRLLVETRERRAELYRVVRALEEATYRIERMNSELLLARREADEARAQKSRFVTTVSHELRGPLNLILGFSRLVALSPERYGDPLPAAYRADVATIYRNSQHLSNLVDDILDLSQIEAERLPLVKDRIDLEDVIHEATAVIQPLAERKGLRLREELPGRLPMVFADRVRLRQVMVNLLTNAARFTERGTITVRACAAKDRIEVSVRDTGCGIPTDELPGMFQEFRQLHLAQQGRKEGSGLGLAISKQLVELHGGEIWAESQVAEGTCVHFTLPVGASHIAAGTGGSEGSRESWSTEKCRLAIVLASPEIARILARYLEGYRVVGTTNEEELGALVEELHPHAVLVSAEAAERVYEQVGVLFDVPIISCVFPHLGERAHSLGVQSYLAKPVVPELLHAVTKQVERAGEMTVLLVDDEPDAVRLLELMLTSLPRPYHILKAYSGDHAWKIMQEVVPDIVFVDLVMPGISGEQLIEKMRQDARLCQVAVAIISGHDLDDQARTFGTPVTVLCRKPLDMADGVRCLQSLLDSLESSYLEDSAARERSAEVPPR